MQKITKYFETLIPNGDIRLYIYRLLATSLIGNTISSRFHIFHGEGNTGKSVLMETIAKAFGDYGKVTDADIFTKPLPGPGQGFPLMNDIKYCRFVSFSETNKQDVFNLQVMKRLTGLQTIIWRNFYSNVYHRMDPPIWRLMMDTNWLPHLLQVDSSIERRVVVLPFSVKFIDGSKHKITQELIDFYGGPEYVKYMQHDLSNELTDLVESGHFTTWLILIYQKYCHRHFDPFKTDIPMPEIIKRRTQTYLDDNNHIKKFFKKNIFKIPPNSGTNNLAISVIYQRYCLWVTQSNIRNIATIHESDLAIYITSDKELKHFYKDGILHGFDFTINKNIYIGGQQQPNDNIAISLY